MTYSFRSNPISCVGLHITDESIVYTELTPGAKGSVVPTVHGSVAVMPGSISGGSVLNQQQLVESFKKLREKTTSTNLRFPSFANKQHDDMWSEIFAVAGFTQSIAVDEQGQLFDYYFTPDHIAGAESTGYFDDLYSLTILTRDNSDIKSQTFPYPLGENDALEVARIVGGSILGSMPIMGELTQHSQVVLKDLHSKNINCFTPEVWQHCFDYGDYLPTLGREESFKYAVPVTLAYWGAVAKPSVLSKELSLEVNKKPVDTNSIEHKLQNITPMSKSDEDELEGSEQSDGHTKNPDKPKSIWLQDVDQLLRKSFSSNK